LRMAEKQIRLTCADLVDQKQLLFWCESSTVLSLPSRVTRLGEFSHDIFAHWATVYSGQFFLENYRSSSLFSTVRAMHWFWRKNGLGYSLGDFFTNSSGHPAAVQHSH
jgi:hypothetical protein